MIFKHFEQHKTFYQLLNERHLIYLLKDVILNMMGLKPDLPKAETYANTFVAYSLYGWTEVWFQRGMKESTEEMKRLFQSQKHLLKINATAPVKSALNSSIASIGIT